MARGKKKKEGLLKRNGKEWLGGEAHVGSADPRSSVARRLQNLRASRAFLMGFGFATGLVIGTGLALLLSRRRPA
jgi:hypothetical protein